MGIPRAGRLSVKLHCASVLGLESFRERGKQQFFTVVEVEEYGRLRSSGSEEPCWDQELVLEVGPHASKLKVCLYTESYGGGEQELVGQGSFCLQPLFEEEGDRLPVLEGVGIPLVNLVGKHQGQLLCSLRHFHSRTPGKFRDALGKEVIDDDVVGCGPQEGPRKVNARSPVASPRARSPRAGSPLPPTPAARPEPRRVDPAA